MARTKKMMLGILLTLGMVLVPSMIANAKTFTTLEIGDVIKEGDIIDPPDRTIAYQQYTEDNSGETTASADTLILVKVDKYYGFKMVDSESNIIEYLDKLFQATNTSDGLYVKDIATIKVEGEPFENGIILAVHETHTHSYSPSWTTNESKHWHECTAQGGNCNAPRKGEAAHTYGSSGDARFTCSVCGYVNENKKKELTGQNKPESPTEPKITPKPVPQDMITINKAPTGVKVKATKKGKATLTWKKFKQTRKTKAIWKKVKKVEVQYSTDKTFKRFVVSKQLGKKKKKLAVKKLKAKTYYYFRVRYVEGPYKVSKWSNVRKVKVK